MRISLCVQWGQYLSSGTRPAQGDCPRKQGKFFIFVIAHNHPFATPQVHSNICLTSLECTGVKSLPFQQATEPQFPSLKNRRLLRIIFKHTSQGPESQIYELTPKVEALEDRENYYGRGAH